MIQKIRSAEMSSGLMKIPGTSAMRTEIARQLIFAAFDFIWYTKEARRFGISASWEPQGSIGELFG